MAAPLHPSLAKCLSFCCFSSSIRNVLIRTSSDSASANFKTDRHARRKPHRQRSIMAEDKTDAGFRKFEVDRKVEKRQARKRGTLDMFLASIANPRYQKMSTDQDWTAVWPGAQTFKWSVVPFPVRQGAIKVPSEGPGDGSPPTKYANAELMKIPNFLHLTPPHISKHCKAIKKFCTPWPEGLETDSDCQKHFPIEVVTSDYLFSSPSVRDTRARVVTVKFKLSDLGFDYHARDKFLRLVGSRYNKHTDEVTIIADRCPLKNQNYDYCMYLITVLYFESWKTEPWESEKTVADMERYFWDLSPSKENVITLLETCQKIDKASTDAPEEKRLAYLPDEIEEDTIDKLEPVQKYKESVEELMNMGENYETVSDYKKSVMKLLNIQTAQKSS